MPATVLIAAPDHLSVLKKRAEFGEAATFADSEALKALDTITRHKPSVVALERMFSTTSRGAALINRIKADPALTACEIRIVAHDGEAERVPSRRAESRTSAGVAVPPAAVPVPPAAVPVPPRAAAAPLDQAGTRRAPRFDIQEGLEVQIDGSSAMIVDLSLVGAQVISPTILKPNQRIRVALGNGADAMRFRGTIAWASFEIPKGTPRYRAGLEFFDVDEAALTRFIDSHLK